MKIQPLATLISVATAWAATSLTSCVVPADYSAGATVTYQPGYYVNTLPPGYHTMTYSGVHYYVHNDIYYRPRGSGYVVVTSPYGHPRSGTVHYNPRTGTVVRELPHGYTVTTIRGRHYYVHDGIYYSGAQGRYVVVERPY